MTTELHSDQTGVLDIVQFSQKTTYSNKFKDTHWEDLIGPSEEVIGGIETKFCPKCHVPAAQLRRTKNGVQIIRDGKVKMTLSGNVTINANGKEQKGFVIKCPNGHKVMIN